MKNPLFWIGIAVGVWMVFQDTGPYLDIHYLREGENIVNDSPEMCLDGDVFDGYVPTEKGLRREMWEERIREILISEFEMESAKAQSVIDEMKGMNIVEASRHLEEYGYYDAHYEYVNTAYHKGTREEINAYIAGKVGLSSKMCKFIFFLTGSFQSCRFCMPESILFILKNACLHLVIHSQLVANQCPVGYRAAIPFFIQFHNPQVECLAYSSLIGECPFFCDFTKA